jgi:hypothetical protein
MEDFMRIRAFQTAPQSTRCNNCESSAVESSMSQQIKEAIGWELQGLAGSPIARDRRGKSSRCDGFSERSRAKEHSPFLDRYPLAIFIAVVVFGASLPHSILHRDEIVFVIEQTDHLRRVQSGFTGDEPFWIPRRPADRKQLAVGRRIRSRLHRSAVGTVWRNYENQPCQSVPLSLLNIALSTEERHKLLALEYPSYAMNPRSFLSCLGYETPLIHRKSRAKQKAQPLDMDKPNDHGFTLAQVAQAIRTKRWDDATANAVLAVVFDLHKVQVAAKERNLPTKRLYQYVWQVRKELRDNPENRA